MINLYRVLYFIVKIILLILKPLLPKKLKSYVTLRGQELNKVHNLKNSFWFHASSGEIEYCKSVIRLLKSKNPKAQIVVTYSSPSAEKLFHNIKDSVDQFIPLTWDSPKALNKLIDYIQPQVLVFSRTDLWPELITQAHKRQIKMGVISYNPSLSLITKLMLKSLLTKLNFISCVDENIKTQLLKLHDHRNISVDGDTRFDQVFYRLSQDPKLKINTQSKIFICGSTWPEDEDVLFNCIQQLVKEKYKIILSPHEVSSSNIRKFENIFVEMNLTCQKLSEEQDLLNINFNSDIFIIDKIGFLADAYRYSVIAFVGGSFKEKIHSVMEPLCCGLPVITGPYFHNNPEAVKYQNRYVWPIRTSDEIIKQIDKLSHFSKNEILTEMKKNLNASERVLKLISL